MGWCVDQQIGRLRQLLAAMGGCREPSTDHQVRSEAESILLQVQCESERLREKLADLEQANQQLSARMTHLEETTQAKDKFLANLSHELRTPLTPVLAAIPAMLKEPGIPDQVRADLEMIRRNTQLEARLMDDLLDMTRICRGKLELQLETVDAYASLRSAIETCGPDAAAKHMEIQSDLRAEEHHVQADPARLQQIFWNLLKNAVKFTADRGQITVRTWNEGAAGLGQHAAAAGRAVPAAKVAGAALVLEITDNGMGIDPAVLPRVFDAFEQGDRATTRRFGGLGLGLAITKALVDRHGGMIAAASAGLGHGATFTVRLPTVVAPLDLVCRPRAVAPARSQPLRILLVEDHADTLRLLSRLLESFKHEVIGADSVESALRAAGNERFDLMISDLGLPDGSGLDLMRQIKASHNLTGIALSGYGTEEDIARSLEAGFAAHLTKPVDFQKLEAAVERAWREWNHSGGVSAMSMVNA